MTLVSELEQLFSSLARTGATPPGGALTTTQRLALIELVDSGPVRLGALADRIGSNDPTVSRAVDGLVEAGLVERRPDARDRRAVVHHATAKGRAWVTRRRGEVAAALDDALARLAPADRERLVALIGKLNAGLAETGPRAGYPALLASR